MTMDTHHAVKLLFVCTVIKGEQLECYYNYCNIN